MDSADAGVMDTRDEDVRGKPLSLSQLFLAILCPLAVVMISHILELGLEKELLVAIGRSAAQLMLAGYFDSFTNLPLS